MAGTLRALIFDVDGTLADTEKNGHFAAFNEAFHRMGLKIRWDIQTYHRYLSIAGGKERLRYIVTRPDFERSVENVDEFVTALHREKVKIYLDILKSGRLPLRTGIRRIINEARKRDIRLGVASSSNEKAVNTLLDHLFDRSQREWFDVVLAGDIVHRKKPDPAIYNMIKEKMGLHPDDCCVLEDSRNGYLASRNAGMKTVVTTNEFTENEDFTGAELVVSGLGDPGCAPVKIEYSCVDLGSPPYITVEHIEKLFG